MHLAFVSIAANGHVNPTLPLVAELVRRGHRVTYATSEAFAGAIAAAGATLLPLGADWWSATAARLPAAGGTEPGQRAAMFGQLVEGLFAGARTEFPHLLSAFGADPPEAVCFDAVTFTGRMAAQKLQLPDIALIPTYASNEHFSLRTLIQGAAGRSPQSQQLWERARTLAAEFTAEFGLPPLNLAAGSPASLNIVFIPREFQPAGGTFDARFHFVGPCIGHRADDDSWRPPAEQLLYISLGTTPLNQRPDFFRLCLQAFGGTGWHVAMATGRMEPESLRPVPENFELRTYFPQLAVLGHAAAFVSHAGMNSTMEALYFAVPMAAVPLQPEQAANAGRMAELGLGTVLDIEELTAGRLYEAVEQISQDRQIRQNLERISTATRQAGGQQAAADAIEAYLAGR